MKKVIKCIGILALASFSLVSCSNDDDSPFGFNESDLYGRWDFSRESYSINGNGTAEVDYTGNQSGCNKDYINFASASAGSEGDFDGADCTLFEDSFTWTKAGNMITLNYGEGDTKTFEVTSVSSTNLVIRTTEMEGSATIVSTYRLIK